MSKNFKPLVGILCVIIVAVIIRFFIIKDNGTSSLDSTNKETNIRRNTKHDRHKWQ